MISYMTDKKQIALFQKQILVWFAKNKRDLPWRYSRDPYTILISEIMLQQTQVARVIPKFNAWMKKFPTLKSLAEASTRDVLFFWSGLGYNRRALYLHKLAKEVVKNNNSVFSQEESVLIQLPGIGKYTARAILCFAFDKQIAVVDTNVRKVILTRFPEVTDSPKEIQEVADMLLPKGKAYEWNQALMDYASAVLKKEKIAIPKQSAFKDSDRYYRGQILRMLLIAPETMNNLLKKFKNSNINKERLKKIIVQLQKEGMLLLEKNTVKLP